MVNKHRRTQWIESSWGLIHVEMLVVHKAQGLGILDVELIKEYPKLKIDSKLKSDLYKKCRHILLSDLWVMGAYELIRFINDKNKSKNIFKENTKTKLKEALTKFSNIRVPLVKFQKPGDKRLYRGLADSYFDPIKGVGWKVHSFSKREIKTEKLYRKDLGDDLLELLKLITVDIRTK